MSSPDGLQYSQADFLARWMPSSTRAGVILHPLPDLAGSLRHTPQFLRPDDSFSSDFAPLPISADSSCLAVDGAARKDVPLNALCSVPPDNSDGELDSLDEMTSKSKDLPLILKLEELRKWQQQMQEQLKAHQLEELLRLQEEQQRLLGMMNGSQDSTGESRLSAAEWEESSFQTDGGHSLTTDRHGVTQQKEELSPAGRRRQLQRGQDSDEVDDEDGTWSSRDSDREQSAETHRSPEQSHGRGLTKDTRKEDKVVQDRPIEGQRKTFEELLEEQLRLEEQRLKSAQQQQQRQEGAAPPKRAFLKRGEGLSRFTNKRQTSLPKMEPEKLQPLARVICRSNSEPTTGAHAWATNCVPRLPIQRKTAALNKENQLRGVASPPQDRAESRPPRTTVLGSHQRLNAEEPASRQTAGWQSKLPVQVKEQNDRRPSGQSSRRSGQNAQPKPVTKPAAKERPEKDEMSSGSRGEAVTAGAHPSGGRGAGPPRNSFDSSFQEKLEHWERHRQLESMELGEFELLEQAAEELSFSSNSSFVVKVLQMDQRKAAAALGLHARRLSSTPIKSPPSRPPDRTSHGGGSSSPMNPTRDDALKSREDEEQQSSGQEDEDRMSNIVSSGSSELEDEEVVVRQTLFPNAHCFPTQTNPPYDKRSYQGQDEDSDSASEPTQDDEDDDDEEESDGVLSDADEHTLIEGRQQVVFDDNDTWNDLDEAPVGPTGDATGASAPGRTLTRKVAASKAPEPAETDPPPLPPPSHLMTKLFPSLKPKTQNAPPHPPPPPPPPAGPEPKPPEVETGQQVQSRLLRERLVELEMEIERFKKENAALSRLRQDSEKLQETLRKERLEFEQSKAEELAKFEEYKKEENRKLQKERRLFEKHAMAARAMPDKKEREEIQALKQQLSSLQDELRGKESRWASTHSRLRQQMDSLGQENASLRDEIKTLEKLRLSAWKRNLTAEKSKDGSKVSENNTSAVPKGVKFASPLDSRGGSSSSPPQGSAAAYSRRGSRESCPAGTGMKSSLRRPSGPDSFTFSSSSSFSAPVRTDDAPPPASKSQDETVLEEKPRSCPSQDKDPPPPEAEHREAQDLEAAQEVIAHPDGKTEKVLPSGDRVLTFPNGTRKEVSADGLTIKVTFFNGDTKQITSDQRVIYHYAETQTTHITYPDGLQVLHFPNQQSEKHFPDGRKEITFPDQTVKTLFPGGREESVLTDGTIIHVDPDGTKEIHFNTGQKEIHTAAYKRREYPDGTVKTVYSDGRQETRYPTGRLRVKDKDGNVVVDSRS